MQEKYEWPEKRVSELRAFFSLVAVQQHKQIVCLNQKKKNQNQKLT